MTAAAYHAAVTDTAAALPRQHVVIELARDIKLAHSVFALPFALLAAVMAAASGITTVNWSRFGGQIILVVLAMVTARTVAMLANRWLDRRLDADNPRTAGRALPAGRVSSGQVLAGIAAAAFAFIVICGGFWWWYANPWPLILSVPVLMWISGYGLFKRWTAACHLYLGSSLALSPIAAAIAIDPTSVTAQAAPWWLSAMVLCWVAGFDVIYALQDVDIDQRDGLFSMPARLGVTRALWVSRALHLAAVAALVMMWQTDPRLGGLFLTAIGLVAGLLVYEHLTVRRWGTTRMALAFFTLNGVVSMVVGGLGIIDVLVAGSP